ncbi:glycerate-2-kinase [Pantoea coffeiphila]|nr:glycerate-2-kinase [Pantoea coffeiphila]
MSPFILQQQTTRRAQYRVYAQTGLCFEDAHDSYSYFHATGDLLITGPTLTNVNDIRVILIA